MGSAQAGNMSDPIDYADVWDDEVEAIIEEIWEARRKMWARFDDDRVKDGQILHGIGTAGDPEVPRHAMGPTTESRASSRRGEPCTNVILW
jgi:hypothetical protein